MMSRLAHFSGQSAHPLPEFSWGASGNTLWLPMTRLPGQCLAQFAHFDLVSECGVVALSHGRQRQSKI